LAISKEKKERMVADYVDRVSHSQALILADYRGLTVAGISELRSRLREVDGTFQVVKNTLFELALQEAGIPIPEEAFQGPIAIGYCQKEVPPVAKMLVSYAKETEFLQIRGAILGGGFVNAARVQALADLPPREVLLAQLLGAVQGPMSALVSTITAPLRELAQVLRARSEQGQEAATETAAEAAA
jgi:large subunit ribosomal protein L10